jgi:peptidoglycan/LPS O-acetylase OafA/YrhL
VAMMCLLAELSWRCFEGPLTRIAQRFRYAGPEPQITARLVREAPATSN